jgi:hypothetical protein
MLASGKSYDIVCGSFQASERIDSPPLNCAILSNPAELLDLPASSANKEASSTVPGQPASVSQRIAVLEQTAITWRQLWTSLGVFTAVVLFISGVFYKSLIPNLIAVGISDSKPLNGRFDKVEGDLHGLSGKIDKLQLTVSATLHPKIIAAAIKDVTSGDKVSLTKTLPSARTLLQVARQNKVPIAQKDLKDISRPLFDEYKSAGATLKHELWLTLIEFASTKTATDSILYPISEGEIEKQKAANNYFEGIEIDLSSKETWKDSIFKNCKIKVSASDKNLILENVRFVDDEFLSLAEHDTSRKLFQTIIENDRLEITSRVAVFSVSPPVVKDTSPLTK